MKKHNGSADALWLETMNICTCKLTQRIMADPYILCQTGLSYERIAIQQHVETHGTDPETGTPLTDARIAPNACLRQFIQCNRGLLLRPPTTPGESPAV